MIDCGHARLRRDPARALRIRWAVVLLFFGALGLTLVGLPAVPQAFVPEEDPGYFIIIVQAPPGASLEYTTTIARQAEKIIEAIPK